MSNIFDYPFENKELYTKRKSLKRNLLTSMDDTKLDTIKIAVVGGATTTDLVQVLELMFLSEKIRVEFYESDYNRYTEEILFNSGSLWEFAPDIIYIHTTVRNLDFSNSVEATYDKLSSLWKFIKNNSKAIIIQNNFELPLVRTVGNLEASYSKGKVKFINELNDKIASFAETSGFYVNDLNYLSSLVGLSKWFDHAYWYNFKYPYSSEATVYVAKGFLSIIKAIKGKSKKCLVLDLDNTLWGGVIGDDGLEGISLGEGSAKGEAYLDFQRYIKGLNDRGVILAVCTKNDFETAKKGFSHPDSILKLQDFSSFQASWGMKTDALKKIAEDLNIGLDSLVFIDDNPAERELVRKQLPMVEVPEVGLDVSSYARYIDINGYFESLRILNEDVNKIAYYAQNKQRESIESEFENYSEFLHSLDMQAEINPFSEMYLDRISQLINKTNQFNLTTKRMDVEEVKSVQSSDNAITLYGRLKDKFGDNGLVTCLLSKVEDNKAFIDVWVMSCRVFKRDLEFAMFDEFVKHCIQKDITQITGNFFKTEKNNVVSDLYEKLGFQQISSAEWVLNDLTKYNSKNNVIKVNQ